jgi:hypothetical protein
MRRISILLFTLVTFLVSASWPQADAPKKQQIITFDAPGAANPSTAGLAVTRRGRIGYISTKAVDDVFLSKLTRVDSRPPGSVEDTPEFP